MEGVVELNSGVFCGGSEHSECNLYVFRAPGPHKLELPADCSIKQACYEVASVRKLPI
jgi:hypothetical protein